MKKILRSLLMAAILVAGIHVFAQNHEYVDLGLPSGTLWATCNVGADFPEEYGDYFAWGETTTKTIYDESTYKYCMGSENTFTKYCNNHDCGYGGFTDNLITLLPEDDAATANWGDDWCTPTKEQWEELIENTKSSWKFQYNARTKKSAWGRLFTATNGNRLFLPAASFRVGDILMSSGDKRNAHYWSSTLVDNKWAGFLNFTSGDCRVISCTRVFGGTVRPVRTSSKK